MNSPVNHARLLLTRQLHRRPLNSPWTSAISLRRQYAQAQEATPKIAQDSPPCVASPAKTTRRELPTPESLPDLNPSRVQEIDRYDVEALRPPRLHHGLDRVLFNPGVYFLQDPNSNVYNFDPQLEKIVPTTDFDFSALPSYKTSSEDRALLNIMKDHDSRFSGSTSSLTGLLQHMHFLISDWRPLDCSSMSQRFGKIIEEPTQIHKLPAAVFLRPQPEGGYAIDKDEHMGSPRELMFIGHLLEKLLTVEKSVFERYLKTHENPIANQDETAHVYNYTAFGPIMVRSQLDAYDPRLRGSGILDVKTRACAGVRMDFEERHDTMKNYEIRTNLGTWESYERERYDLIRTMMMKYSLQVRLGRMSGVFVAYHNVRRLFGFEYISLSDMDLCLHGQTNPELGDQELRFSMALLNIILSKAEETFGNNHVWLQFDSRKRGGSNLRVFAEPVTDELIKEIQEEAEKRQIEYERSFLNRENKPQQDEDLSLEVTQDILVKDLEAFQVEAASRVNCITDSEVCQTFKALEGQLENQLASLRLETVLTVEQQQHITDIIESIKDLIDNHSNEFIEPDEKDGITDTSQGTDTDGEKKPFLETHSPDPNKMLVMEIRVKNFMHGGWNPFPVQRAIDITKHNLNEWTMKYSLKMIEDDAVKLDYYRSMQKRRLNYVNRKGKDGFYDSEFIKKLLRISRNGYRYRRGRDSLTKLQEPIVFKPYMD